MSRYEKLLKELTEAHGAPGFEDEAIEVMKKHIKAADEVTYDKLGSLIARKKGKSNSPKIMVAGHIDEIAFIVKEITAEGYIRFIPLGGWWGHVALAHNVIIKTSKGDIPGVVGSKPPHILEEEERKKVMQLKDMFIDVGACDGFDVKSIGVKPGDPIIPDSRFQVMGNRNLYMSKAFDDRIGAAAAVAVINGLKGINHPNTVYGVGTVQEEVGLRGAGTAAHVIDPDVAIVADVSLATDSPGSTKETLGRLGTGPSINVMDGSMIPNRHLRDFTVKIAEKNKIPFHFSSIERGGTDGGRIHMSRAGVPTIYLGIATRYIHSHTGVIHKVDFDNLVKLITEMVKRLDARTVASFTKR
ncbi:MAG: M42 family metallopeptidase [Candidatus Zixiibacteriota bacterium]|nr:MAG: M42 family metallopeptidase [candidate division Zixibacteria bacterium]